MRCCITMALDASSLRILLLGPRAVQFKPLFAERGYAVRCFDDGVVGMSVLEVESQHVIFMELDLGNLTAAEFLMATRHVNPSTAFLLLDDPSHGARLLKALQAGFDGYVAMPPDMDRISYEIERHVQRTTARPESQASNSSVLALTSEGPAARAGAAPELRQTMQEDDLAAARREQHQWEERALALQARVEALMLAQEQAEHGEKNARSQELKQAYERAAALEAREAKLRDDILLLERRLADTQREVDAAHSQAQSDRLAFDAELARQRASAAAAATVHPGTSAREAELIAALETVRSERERAIEQALDAELAMEGLQQRIVSLEDDVRNAEARAQAAEEDRRKERLRSVERREHAASSTAESFHKLEQLISENAAAQQRVHTLERDLHRLRLERDEALRVRDDARAERDKAEQARLVIDRERRAVESAEKAARAKFIDAEMERDAAIAERRALAPLEQEVADLKRKQKNLENELSLARLSNNQTEQALHKARKDAEVAAQRATASEGLQARVNELEQVLAGRTADVELLRAGLVERQQRGTDSAGVLEAHAESNDGVARDGSTLDISPLDGAPRPVPHES